MEKHQKQTWRLTKQEIHPESSFEQKSSVQIPMGPAQEDKNVWLKTEQRWICTLRLRDWLEDLAVSKEDFIGARSEEIGDWDVSETEKEEDFAEGKLGRA